MTKPMLPKRLRFGLYVFLALMVLEVVEYVVGVGFKRGALVPLAVLAIVAAWPIAQHFMHISQLWRHGQE